ncbi:uncharacterized protein alms1 [Oncorhynchus nerka]|uniref:uncharacterized protein alms1 n=1 Tax=Oncorhynchus nerka TaxID=8023 RepID=UPI0031B82A6D
MEPQEPTSPADEADVNRFQKTESWFHLPAEEDRSQFLGLEFQDSRLSPALALLPEYDFSGYSLFQQTTDLEFAPLRGSPDVSVASERFLIPQAKKGSSGVVQPSDPHHSPLSQHPLAYNSTLSEHPLGHTSTLSRSEERASSCCSLSEHSMSPGEGLGQPEEDRYPATVRDNEGQKTHRSGTRTSLLDPDRPLAVLPDDNASFLSGDIPVRKLLDLLQKEVGMPSGSSGAVSSASETSRNRTNFFGGESRSDRCVSKPDGLREERDVSQRALPDVSPELLPDVSPPITGKREGPQGGASVSPEKTEKLKSKHSSRMSESSNITIRSLSSQPDESSNGSRRQLCSELERSLDSEPGAETQGDASRGPIPSLHSEVNTPDIVTNTPNVSTTGSAKGRLSVTRGLRASVLGPGAGPGAGPGPGAGVGVGPQFSAGFSVERGHRERDLWSSGNQTGTEPDVSFLSLLPQPVSQSTPGVFLHAPVRSSTKLSALSFNMEVSQRSSGSRVSSQHQPAVDTLPDRATPVRDPPLPARETVQEPSGRSHHSLPSLNYLQKVDAWKANQSSNKMSFYDNLSLQGFSGVSPKQKAYDAVSDSLTRMLTLPQRGNQTLSMCESGPSSPSRGEAAGSGLPEREDTAGPVGGPSPLGRSQSHSSLNTVVTSIQRAQHAQTHTDQDSSQAQPEEESATGQRQPGELERSRGGSGSDRVQSGGGPEQPSGAPTEPSPFISLGRFNNVSSKRDVLSSSRDSGQNFEVPVRAASSSVVSLEVDNYAPYWSSKPSSPHRERELNIEERIPMYLHNLGIDQSPSTILNPFGPRGPIREPEFSPTDLCTIQGSTATGTPTKSAQPSEGDSPQKGEFSRSSLLSVASSMSLPLSVDSLHLHPIRSQAENTRSCLSPSPGPERDRSPSQGSQRMAFCPPVENTVLQDSQQDPHCLQPSSPAPQSTQPLDFYQLPAPQSTQPLDFYQLPAPQSTQPLDLHIYQLPAPESKNKKYPGLLPDLQSTEQHQRDSRVNVSTQAAIELAGGLESSADSLSQYRDGDRDSLYRNRDMDRDVLSQYRDGDRDSLYRNRDMDRDVLSQYRDSAVASCPQVNTTMDRSNPDDSFVGSQTLQDIRLLLGRAENIVSGGSSISGASSGASSHLLHSDDDMLLLSLRRKMEVFQDSSFTSSSGGAGVGDPRSHCSLLCSSSDSMLPAVRNRESSAYSGEGHVRLTREAEHQSTPAREESGRLLQDREHYGRPQDSSEDREHHGRPRDSSEDREHHGRPRDSSEDREHHGRPRDSSEDREHHGRPRDSSEDREHHGRSHDSSEDREHHGRPRDSSEDREHHGRPRDSSEDREHHGRSHDSSEDREHYGRPPQDISGSSSTFLLTESVRRAEPEGCSAGLSDTRIGPVLLSVMPVSQPGPSLGDAGVGKLQQAPTTTVGGGHTEVQMAPEEGSSSSSSSSCPVGSEQGCGGLSEPAHGGDQGGDALSDGGSSSSSLAARVARLLQSESPATVASLSSRASTATADLEESRAREWLRLKVSGQLCETLELNMEDRQRIEEIKREILFKHPLQSTDTDSSTASSLVGPGGQPPSLPQPEEQLVGEKKQFRALKVAEDCLSHQLQQLSRNPFEDSIELRTPLRQDLEGRVRQIALREGLYVLPRTHPPPLTSITIASSRRSPLPEPLQVSQFTLEGVSQPTVQGWLPQTRPQQQGRESTTTSTHCSMSRDTTTMTGSQANSSSLYPRDRKTRLGQEPGQGPRQEPGQGPRQEPRQEPGLEPGQEPGQGPGQEPRREPGLEPRREQLPGRDQENPFTGLPHSAAPLPLTPVMYGQISRSHPDEGRPGSIMGSGADWVSGAWTTRTGQVSHLHVTLSPGPKGAEERSRRLLSFAPVRHSSAVSSSVDEDESLGYAPEPAPANKTGSQENRDPIWRQGQETADASVQITTATSTFPQCFTPPQRLTGTGPSRQAALTVLLPYKPHGSEEMFYVPQTLPEPQLSPIRSDSTMESSHPGSDDAVPPRFNIEILGSREQQVDRGVNIKHTEGIYSKRQRLGENYSMERTGTTVPDDEGQPLVDQRTPQSKCFSHVTGGLTRVPAIPITTTRGPAGPTTTTRGPVIPTTTTRGPAVPTTTTRGPAVPTTTTRGPAIPITTTRGPAVPTTTTRGPAIPITTTRGPAIPTTTTRGPAIPTTTTRGPAIPTTTTRGPAIPTTTTRGPAIPTTTTRGPAIPTTTTRGPAIPTTTTRGPAIPTTTTRGPAIPTSTTRGPSAAMRDHGTSITTSTHTQGVPDTDHPVQPSLRCSLGVGEEELEVFQPLHVEMDYSSMDLHHHFPKTHHLQMDHQISNAHLVRTSAPHPGMEREPLRRDHSLAQRSGSTLDQLWRRFSERWSLEEARPTNEREASLLERLERLSRLIHSTGTSAPPEPEPTQQTDTTEQEGGGRRRERKSGRKEEERRRGGVEEGRREESSSGRSDPHAKANQAKASVPRQAWEQQDEEPRPAEGEDSSSPSHGPAHSFSPSHLPARSQYLCPAERERSGSVSGETSSSMSTIDTARLVRAFGAHRVRGLNTQGTNHRTSHRTNHRTSHSLSKLYNTILQQRQSKEQRRGRPRETLHIPPVPSESTGTDNSVIPADSASSTSTYTLPSHRGPSHSKKAVKHVSKGVQAGDLEIVRYGTRRHTRDVGTTFPSPGSARGARVLPSSHSGSKRGRAGDRSPPKTQRKRKMSQPSARPYYPQGVSWYIPAEDPRSEGRKENKPEQQPPQGPAWFEPYSRTTRPWREPLRQRQIQARERLTDRLQTNQLEADRDRPSERQHTKRSIITPPGPEPTGNAPAALVRISLQVWFTTLCFAVSVTYSVSGSLLCLLPALCLLPTLCLVHYSSLCLGTLGEGGRLCLLQVEERTLCLLPTLCRLLCQRLCVCCSSGSNPEDQGDCPNSAVAYSLP